MRQLLPCLFALVIASPAAAATYTVTSTDDDGPGTLRQAIVDANDHIGADTIAFAIPGTGVHTIAPIENLPLIDDALVIDGYTQEGSQANTNTPAQGGLNGTLAIELSGENLSPYSSKALSLGRVDVTVRGLVINRFQVAILLPDPAAEPPDYTTTIEGCYLGTDASGAQSGGMNQSVGVTGADEIHGRVVIGGPDAAARNIISGFTESGGYGIGTAIVLHPALGGPVIEGNLIGTDAGGTVAVPNRLGIGLAKTGSASVGSGARIKDNVVSGNTSRGVQITCGYSPDTTCIDGLAITGNVIGARRDGGSALPNGTYGIRFLTNGASAAHILVGGSTPESENTIAWNGTQGLTIANNNKGTIEIARNRIFGNAGLDIDLPNPESGRNNNDSHDSDGSVGPDLANRLQNYPVIASVSQAGNQLTVRYRVPTATTYATYPLTVRFYRSATSGGDRWLADDTYEAIDAELEKQIVLTLPPGVPVAGLIATAADADGNTSEFSDPFVFGDPDLIFANGFDP